MTHVLCRRETNDFGQPVRYCAKPIKTKNGAELCDDCLSRYPFWPLNNDGTPCTPGPSLMGVR